MASRTRRDKYIAVADKHRLAMLELLKETSFANEPRLHVTDIELQLPAPSELYRTVHALHEAYPNVDFWFAYGTDSYLDMPNWVRGPELMKMLKVVVFARTQGVRAPTSNVSYLEVPAMYDTVSSTAVRQAIARGKTARRLLSRPILAYVLSHRLYLAKVSRKDLS
jgi:nicotinate (nicotinamide) nucleotide adenylyltransferase